MKCPIDNTKLKIKNKNQVTGQMCDQCNGIFYEGKYVVAFKYNYNTDVLDKAVIENLQRDSLIPCPNCSSIMKLADIRQVEIDVCISCHGIWFDNKEIFHIIDNHGELPGSGGSEFLTFFAGFLGQ